MKFVLMHFMRNENATSVPIENVPQMDTDEEMIEYVRKAQLYSRYLRLFEQVDHFEVVDRDWVTPHRPNSIIRMNAVDLLAKEEKYYNKVAKKKVKAKQITGRFVILNSQGDERSGDPNDWLVIDSDGTLRVCTPEVFEGNYVKLPVLYHLNCDAVVDDLGTEYTKYKLEYGPTCEHCSVCGELVQEGWQAQHYFYHDRCVSWQAKTNYKGR